MRIQKKFQGNIPENKILNMYSQSITDTYSCDMINNLTGSGPISETDPTVPEYVKNITEEDIEKWNSNTYTAGTGINISSDNVISNTITNTSQLNNDSNFINEIKTINGQSLIGQGNIIIEGDSKYLSYEIKPPADYTTTDTDRISSIMLGDITPTDEDYAKYDLNGDGVIDILDLKICRSLIEYNLKSSVPGRIIIDASDYLIPIKIINSNNEIIASLGVNSITRYLTVNGNLSVSGDITSVGAVEALTVKTYRIISGEGRVTSANVGHNYTNGFVSEKLNISSGSMTIGKPDGDGYIKTFFWDNAGEYDVQLFIRNGNKSLPPIQYRQKLNGSWGAWYILHPYKIGDVVITSTNVGATEMANRYGGTWELIDKEFAPKRISGTNLFTNNSTNTTSSSCYCTVAGHSVTVEVGLTNKVSITDTELSFGTFNLNNIGITAFNNTLDFTAFTDAGNCAVFMTITAAGVLKSVDIIPDNNVASGRFIEGYATFTITPDNMLDSACNKFYWKRTA